jgi:hypothetical protein
MRGMSWATRSHPEWELIARRVVNAAASAPRHALPRINRVLQAAA